MPVFTREFCQQLLEEIEYFESDRSLPKGRPNTMNNYGVSRQAMVSNLQSVYFVS